MTALIWAARNGHADAVKRLCENKANVEAQNKVGFLMH